MRILFQGDSITDCCRHYDDPTSLGEGYAFYAAQLIREAYPDVEFEFINRGIGGNRTENLVERWQKDCIDLQPDIVSVLIGVNDTWHRTEKRNWIPNNEFEANYRNILSQIKEKTNAKILMLEQYLVDVEDKAFFREDINPKIDITRKLAREYADAFVPTDGIFAEATIHEGPLYWTLEGIHTTPAGAQLIAKHYLEAIRPLIEAKR